MNGWFSHCHVSLLGGNFKSVGHVPRVNFSDFVLGWIRPSPKALNRFFCLSEACRISFEGYLSGEHGLWIVNHGKVILQILRQPYDISSVTLSKKGFGGAGANSDVWRLVCPQFCS